MLQIDKPFLFRLHLILVSIFQAYVHRTQKCSGINGKELGLGIGAGEHREGALNPQTKIYFPFNTECLHSILLEMESCYFCMKII